MPESMYGYWLPPDISTHGAGVDRLITSMHWFMAIVFAVWFAFFFYCIVRFRARPGHQASRKAPAVAMVIAAIASIAVFEVVLDLAISVPVWSQVKTEFPPEDEALRVRVVAEQFAWNFHYPGPDGIFGRTRPTLMTADNLIGLDYEDPAAADDVVTNNDFRITVNKPVICDLSSKDVIHSFSIPVLRVKQDVIPGMVIPIWFEATKAGEYQVACAQLCGNNHYMMKADLTVYETEEEFAKWYAYMAPEGDEEEEEEEEESDEDAATAEEDEEWE